MPFKEDLVRAMAVLLRNTHFIVEMLHLLQKYCSDFVLKLFVQRQGGKIQTICFQEVRLLLHPQERSMFYFQMGSFDIYQVIQLMEQAASLYTTLNNLQYIEPASPKARNSQSFSHSQHLV